MSSQSRQIMDAHRKVNETICEIFFPDRSEDFWKVFRTYESEDPNEPEYGETVKQRLLNLEQELEDTRRAIGYLMEFLIDNHADDLPNENRRKQVAELWRQNLQPGQPDEEASE